MATIKQYTANLWKVHRTVSQKLGMSIAWGAPDERVRALSTDLLLAGLIKVLTDNAVITDQALNAVYSAISAADLPRLSVVAQEPDQTVADPDLGT